MEHISSLLTQNLLNNISREIIGCAIEVHKELGSGLLESVYEKCMSHLLVQNGLKVTNQKKIPIVFKRLELDCDLRFDLLVEDLVIVELKTVESILPIHEAQLLTYLKLMDKPEGVLINFNCVNIFNEEQKTFVTKKFKELPKGY